MRASCRAPEIRAVERRRKSKTIVDVDDRLVRCSAEQRQQLEPRLRERELRAADVAAVLQHGDPRSRHFERRNRAARQPPLVQLNEPLQRLQVVRSELEPRLRFEHVDARQLDVELHAPHRFGELRLGDLLPLLGERGAQLALVGAFERHVDAHRRHPADRRC